MPVSEAYVGEIRMFSGTFAPMGWLLCQGQLLSIAENDVLFSLLGTTFGGDGQTTFALPDLRGRVPVHPSSAYPQGQRGGSETITLTAAQMPAHTHTVGAQAEAGTTGHPEGAVWAQSAVPAFAAVNANQPMNGQAIAAAGGNQPHDNMMPFLCINFIIATEGIYPQRS